MPSKKPPSGDDARPFTRNDLRLLAHLWPLLRPLKKYLVYGILMITSSAIISLALPYLTKIAIDRYILPLGDVLNLSPELAASHTARLKADMFIELGDGKTFLAAEFTQLLDEREKRELLQKGLLEPEKYYLATVGQELDQKDAQKLFATLEGSRLFSGHIVISEESLKDVPSTILKTMRQSDIVGLGKLALAFSILMVFGYCFDLGQRYFMEVGSQKLGYNIREALLSHLFTLSQSFFDRQESGRLTSRLTSDINNINALVKSTAGSFFSDLLSLVGVMIIMFGLSPKLAVTALILTPLAAIISYHFSKIARTLQRDLRAKLAAINQAFSESMIGIAVIQAFRREKLTAEEFSKLNEANFQTGYQQVHSVAIFLPLIDLCASVVLALILWVGGIGVFDNTVSLGVLAAFVGYTARFFNPIKDLAEKVNTFQSAFASLERIVELMNLSDVTPPPKNPLSPPKPGGAFEFKGVSFKYGTDMPIVLNDVSFKVARGESVALVGATGSGKSSVINLMLRFYDPTSGSIAFDGVDLRDLDLRRQRKRIGLVTQDVYLYSASVMDNLRLGRQDLSENQVLEASKAVGADDFIQKLPLGYQELLGPSGRGLSAGQRQLIACARALIEAPELVILDEATAFVDSETELLIENAMKTIFKQRTSVVIAHRLSTIRRVDRIMVMNQGRIIESGSHSELMKQKGIYYHLATLQGQL
ncbi:MAG: ABC transporter ATP-binding protein/permease [Deltaproteobacteria bacterium]|jgi:ABC-type multidrug transport system fused ATPase/permease subunit|nr:ABC transporter ATP-binding protein/permease [Deltaproteobacteria bacterium]